MGLQSSKLDHHHHNHHQLTSSDRGKTHHHDDGLSKATELTDDSSTLLYPSSPPTDDDCWGRGTVRSSFRQQAGWKRNSRSYPNLPQSSSTSRHHAKTCQDSVEKLDAPTLKRRDSDPSQSSGSRHSEPVKCPPRNNSSRSTYNDGLASSPPEGEDVQYLTRLYDSRTWEMYRRITEARKNSLYSYRHSPLDQQPTENTSEWENLQHDVVDSAESGHEMIFLFDFD